MNERLRNERLARTRAAMAEARADWLLVPSSADFQWLTGAPARATERLLVFALPREGDPFVLVPRLEADALAEHAPWAALEVWSDGDDALARLSARIGLDRHPSLLLGEGYRTGPLLALAGGATCAPAAPVLAPLRAVKDAEELALVAQAAANADRIIEALADDLRPGMTEREVARMALSMLEDAGDTAPWAICASGPNSAHPHHMNGDRRLEADDVVILDLGAFTGGYGSDITRVYLMGDPPADFERVYRTVDEARLAGIAAVRDGRAPEDVDRAGREVIERAGFGEYFLHRIGHGVGLEVHEPPYMTKGNREPLRAGMVHSVEPGIYLEGRFGVRLEDLVVVESDGARVLNQAPRDPRPPRRRS